MFHHFKHTLDCLPLPTQFTYPFFYDPHPLSMVAVQELQSYLLTRKDWFNELNKGKMFGVLVVSGPQNEMGYLAAFSGILAGSYQHEYFVPPVYDLLNPDGFFKNEEENISNINRCIAELESSSGYKNALAKWNQIQEEMIHELESYKNSMKVSKLKRDALRKSNQLSENEAELLIKESQFEKATYKRLQKSYCECLDKVQEEIDVYKTQIERLKKERKTRSVKLQNKLFEQFRLLNARGEERDLCDIFSSTLQKVPPAGAGECAAPKLLQYAYVHGWKPLAMAEFWWGQSPKSEIRIHGHYYPSCRHKCEPILNFMLQGLNVEPNPLLKLECSFAKIEVVYEDEYCWIVHKPAGMLAVPGKEIEVKSLLDYMKDEHPEINDLYMVHRLDMDTSGLLLVAKTKEMQRELQSLFEKRKVKKRYVALLDGLIPDNVPRKGYIKLPLRPDYNNRPYQLVDETDGKVAVTRYEIIGQERLSIKGENHTVTKIHYYPETGRTHQLRIHSAHTLGMGLPILGDPLYGKKSVRMFLHAAYLEFRHPVHKGLVKVELPFLYHEYF